MQVRSFKVEGLNVVSTIDIVQRDTGYMQVLKIWDLLPNEDIPRLINHIDCIFGKCTEDFIDLCNENCLEGYAALCLSSSELICFMFK